MLKKERAVIEHQLMIYKSLRELSATDKLSAGWVRAIDEALHNTEVEAPERAEVLQKRYFEYRGMARNDVADACHVSHSALATWTREFHFTVMVAAVEAGVFCPFGIRRVA